MKNENVGLASSLEDKEVDEGYRNKGSVDKPEDETGIPDNNEPSVSSTDNFRSLFSICEVLNITCNLQEDCKGKHIKQDCSFCWLNDINKNKYCGPPWHQFSQDNGKNYKL